MTTDTAPPIVNKEQQPYQDPTPERRTGLKLALVAVVWIVGWALLKGKQTLTLGGAELTDFHRWLTEVKDDLEASREGNFFLDTVIGTISDGLDWLFTTLSELFSVAAFPRPVPEVGWVGVLALLVWLAYAVAGWKSAVLVGLATLTFGFLGAWSDSIDLLIITVISVLLCVVIGIPTGIAMARRRGVSAVITPVLDAMQTMPAFAYLIPLTLFWGIGAASAVVVTLIYAIPPLIRITEHGLRSVPASTIEAADSLGVSRGQLLRQVQLPMAKRTIVVGINQCTMAALSMATIAALINGPGLGKPVVKALQAQDVGTAFVGGLAIVIMAIMLDRTTTAASERVEQQSRGGVLTARKRQLVVLAGAVGVGIAIYISRTYLWAAEFSENQDYSRQVADKVNSFTESFVDSVEGITDAFKNVVSYGLLNPLQSLLGETPWWLMAAVILAAAFFLGGVRAAIATFACELVILGTGLWHDAMLTLTMTLVATLMVMVIAIVTGVAMGRSRRTDLVLRPFLDAFQTIPSFVYLVPVLALFSATRFTAITAAVLYAVPVATKLVADGIRGVSPTTVEAAMSAGTTRWQMITRVQIPMARESLVLAANQGLLYVLSMVVIGGLVGGGSLGYLVVAGFSQAQLFGKGLAAAIAITALGIMLDRITRNTAARYGRS